MIIATFVVLVVYIIALAILTSEKTYVDYLLSFILAWVSGGINSIFAFLLINLIVLHIYLICKGISTYEFIVAQREEEKRKKD
jgi:hypothetical protein